MHVRIASACREQKLILLSVSACARRPIISRRLQFSLLPHINVRADAISAIGLKTNIWQCGGDNGGGAGCHKNIQMGSATANFKNYRA